MNNYPSVEYEDLIAHAFAHCYLYGNSLTKSLQEGTLPTWETNPSQILAWINSQQGNSSEKIDHC